MNMNKNLPKNSKTGSYRIWGIRIKKPERKRSVIPSCARGREGDFLSMISANARAMPTVRSTCRFYSVICLGRQISLYAFPKKTKLFYDRAAYGTQKPPIKTPFCPV